MSQFTIRYKKQIFVGLTAVVLLLSLIGSYQYYSAYAAQVAPDRFWSAILYSTIQLYVFSPTASPGEATPLCYEIAKWAAPLCTALWLFNALESLFRHQLGLLKRRIGKKKQLAVFGYNDLSDIFIQNLIQNNKKSRNSNDQKRTILLVVEKPLEKETSLVLERSGVTILQIDLFNQDHFPLWEQFRKLQVETLSEAILFYDESTWNFTILTGLLEYIGKKWGSASNSKHRLSCAIRCEDRTVQKIIADYCDQHDEANHLSLSMFSIPDIAANALFQEHPLFENCLSAVPLAPDMNAGHILSHIPNPHLLIAGVGRYGQAVLEKALLSGTLSPCSKVKGHEKLKITIIDSEALRFRDILESRYPRLRTLCEIEYIASDIRSSQVEKQLAGLAPVTFIAICFSNQTTCVYAMEKLRAYLTACAKGTGQPCIDPGTVPIAVRMKNDDAVIRYRTNNTPICPFGTIGQILTFGNIVRYDMEEQAKSFHQTYMELQTLIHPQASKPAHRDDLWNALLYEKKEACRAQVLNRPYFLALIKRLKPLPDRCEALDYQDGADRFLEKLAAYPDLDSLAHLEHTRWCAFCYCCGYAGWNPEPGEKGQEHRFVLEDGKICFGKVHNCLIDDWNELKMDPTARNTIIYDVCSIYGYAGI
ncbi:hypothetical protein DWX10_18025 [Clostridium sp. AF18-27]|uniref:hypothetical protein n=1 Tax=Enterocloster lavalensis TaxID=460384 RepID=UPI000E478AB7|nr:hypothetical protein [Enterocloster lavalensis]RHR51471.1 hypothetical protein DWX10_18025 [Clostridium sp. AF18-27]